MILTQCFEQNFHTNNPNIPSQADLISLILEHSDIEIDLGNGNKALRISQKLANKLCKNMCLEFAPENLIGSSVIWNDDKSQILNFIKLKPKAQTRKSFLGIQFEKWRSLISIH